MKSITPCILMMSFLAYLPEVEAKDIHIEPLSPLEWIDTGSEQAHSFILRNDSPHAIVLLSLNKHTFKPPDFDSLCRMKAPRADWQSWRNVLLPGQTTTVTFPATRQSRGAYELETEFRYLSTQESRPAWIARVVPGDASEGTVSACLLPVNAEYYVSYPSKIPPLAARQRVDRWTFKVLGHPRLEQLGLYPLGIEKFALDLPHFGTVIWRGELAYQLKAEEISGGIVTGEVTLDRLADPMGRVDMKTIRRLARDFGAGKTVTVHALSATTLETVGISAQKKSENDSARSAESEFAHAEIVFSGQLKPADLADFWRRLRAQAFRLSIVPHYGYVVRPPGA